jgi:hypothetical protein
MSLGNINELLLHGAATLRFSRILRVITITTKGFAAIIGDTFDA